MRLSETPLYCFHSNLFCGGGLAVCSRPPARPAGRPPPRGPGAGLMAGERACSVTAMPPMAESRRAAEEADEPTSRRVRRADESDESDEPTANGQT